MLWIDLSRKEAMEFENILLFHDPRFYSTL